MPINPYLLRSGSGAAEVQSRQYFPEKETGRKRRHDKIIQGENQRSRGPKQRALRAVERRR